MSSFVFIYLYATCASIMAGFALRWLSIMVAEDAAKKRRRPDNAENMLVPITAVICGALWPLILAAAMLKAIGEASIAKWGGR